MGVRVGGGWGLGGEAVKHLDILNGAGPNFLKGLGYGLPGDMGALPSYPCFALETGAGRQESFALSLLLPRLLLPLPLPPG